MKRSLFIIIFFSMVLSAALGYAQGYGHYGNTNNGYGAPLAVSTSTWSCVFTDTTRVPQTPYTGGYGYFGGSSQIYRSDNVLYSTQFVNADTVSIITVFSRSSGANVNLLGGSQSNWILNAGAQSQNILALYPGNGGYIPIATFHDTLMHTYQLLWHKTDSLLHKIIDGVDSGTVKMHWTNTYNATCAFAIGTFNLLIANGSTVPGGSFKGCIKLVWLDMWKGATDSLHHWTINQAGQILYDTVNWELYPSSSTAGSSHLRNGQTAAKDSCDVLFVPDSAHTTKFSSLGTTVITNKNVGINNWIFTQVYNTENIYDTSLAVCGTFNRVNATATNSNSGLVANGIALYNIAGGTWSVLSTGVDNNYVENIRKYKTGLIAIGPYTSMAGVANTLHIAKWDGTAWSAMGTGISGNGRAFYADGDSAWAGGVFTTAGGVTVNNIAKWDGTSWSALGTGTNGEVEYITKYNGVLYICGRFTTANGVSCPYIAYWNGTTFVSLGTGGNNVIYWMCVFNGKLFAGGTSSSFGGTAGYLGMWNGSSWTTLITSMTGFSGFQETRMTIAASMGSYLYVGGNWSRLNGHLYPRLFRTDGTNICPVGSEIDGEIYGLTPFSTTTLYIGGLFNLLDGIPAQDAGKYTP